MGRVMKFFLDTASLEEIEKWKPYGIVDGVTTNPSLLSKEKCNALEQLKQNIQNKTEEYEDLFIIYYINFY